MLNSTFCSSFTSYWYTVQEFRNFKWQNCCIMMLYSCCNVLKSMFQTNLPVFKVKESSVRRRYSDFEWLRNELERDSKVSLYAPGLASLFWGTSMNALISVLFVTTKYCKHYSAGGVYCSSSMFSSEWFYT